MQLIKKLFGRGPDAAATGESAQFQDSEPGAEAGSGNAPRRDLVQLVLRDSMRRHGIPSAWIECRIVSVLSRDARTGMHVQLIVRDGVDRLLTYVPAFQTSFMQEVTRFDPRASDWLLSLSWQFQNLTAVASAKMPEPGVWAAAPTPPLKSPGPSTPAPTVAALPQVVPAVPAKASLDAAGDAEMLEDLQALYAIRDAALRPTRAPARGPAGERDFESTRPAADQEAPGKSLSSPPSPRPW